MRIGKFATVHRFLALTFIRHKYTLFLSLDGNFKQQLKIKNCDEDDIELFVAFFARKANFDAYMQSESASVEVCTFAVGITATHMYAEIYVR